MIEFPCPHCSVNISAEPEHYGTSVNCPKCSGELVVPSLPGQSVIAQEYPVVRDAADGKSDPRPVPSKLDKSKILILCVASVILILMTTIGIIVARKVGQIEDSTTAGTLPPLSQALPDGLVLVPAGELLMGDALDGIDDAPPHKISLSAFYIAKHEVTHGAWKEVRQWALKNGYPDLPDAEIDARESEQHPAYGMRWDGAIKWCNARSEMEGLKPCYTLNGGVYRKGSSLSPERFRQWNTHIDGGVKYHSFQKSMLPKGANLNSIYKEANSSSEELKCDFSANGYRLPTEAEWERAARGGQDGLRFPWGNTISQWKANYTASYYDSSSSRQEMITTDQLEDESIPDQRKKIYLDIRKYGSNAECYKSKAWDGPVEYTVLKDEPFRHHKAHFPMFHLPVGGFDPNRYGIYDMSGNASEWCWDTYSKGYYLKSHNLNPTGPPSVSWDKKHGVITWQGRVVRGGGGDSYLSDCRVAARDREHVGVNVGFRVVRR